MQKKFQVRETGYYSCNEHFGHYYFFQPATLRDFSHNDAMTVNFSKHKIHRLVYQPCYRERPYKQDQADNLAVIVQPIQDRGKDCCGCQGGHVEKDLFNRLIIPCLDL